MKYHITITDNETQEVLVDADTGAIIGGYSEGDDIHTIIYVYCNKLERVATASGAMRAALGTLEDEPPRLRKIAIKFAKAGVKSNKKI